MSGGRRRLGAALAATLACAPAPGSAPATAPTPAHTSPAPSVPVARADAAVVRRSEDPAVARDRGWMPLASTGVPAFRAGHPTYDGRGVLIAILDSGVDPSVDGLEVTSDGSPKLLDLRDFSTEGRVELEPAEAADPAVLALSPDGPWYVGRIAERPLGDPPAADLDGDGDAADTLTLFVARDSAGWFLLTDTDLDGVLSDERPVRDYLVERRWFGWARGGRRAGLGIAVNLTEEAGAPVLDLVFDTSAHGTHVAGIAAGHRIYGTPGLDGVAPGARLIGLKIANNARGGVSTTGSMLAAMDYAIRFAAARDLPLVMNLSFGVGNEAEGEARIDAIVDSVLSAHPEVVFTISAGNDGPGLSTVGFPGSARRAISVGASLPASFLPEETRAGVEQAAYFSARGGELAKPDLIAPGLAYSTVPPWNAGEEQSGGTSMASPHVAGLAALLVSGLVQEGRPVRAADVRAALVATARRDASRPWFEQGAGLPRIGDAWRWLARGHAAPGLAVAAGAGPGSAAFHLVPRGAAPAADTFRIAAAGAAGAVYRLRTDAAWLSAPDSVAVGPGTARVVVRYDTAAVAVPGVYAGTVTGWTADTTAGPAFELRTAVVVPHTAGAPVFAETGVLPPSAVRHITFAADTGRGLVVSVAAAGATAFLHEPGGQPYRGGHARVVRSRAHPGVFEVDASDVVGGAYELAVAAPPTRSASASVSVRHAPVRLSLRRDADSITAEVAALDSVAGDLLVLLTGAERRVTVRASGGAEQRLDVGIPGWARSAVIDVRHPGGQWERFTDFGVTLLRADGSIVEQSPMNYAFGRLAFDVPPSDTAARATLSLLPGLADPASEMPWAVEVAIRFYADTPVALADAQGGAVPLRLAPGERRRIRHPLVAAPWPLGEGFHPLAVLAVQTGDAIWSREAGLPGPASSGE